MINFPIITRMEIRGFGLYPGRPGRQGLETSFARGLTLIVGANGLGKSTLVNILFRTLTGPFDIGGIDRVDVLGNLDLTEAYRGALRTLFANRVADHARQASIRLDVAFGSNTLSIERSLADLSITDLRDGSTPLLNRPGYCRGLMVWVRRFVASPPRPLPWRCRGAKGRKAAAPLPAISVRNLICPH